MQSYPARKLGMDSEALPSNTLRERDSRAEIYEFPQAAAPAGAAEDHFIVRDGRCYAGTHLIVDLWGARRLDDVEHIREALRRAVDETGATLLHVHLHRFTVNGGVSGVAVLAESHISIHTWPECDYAALDVFMCGACEPQRAISVFEEAFAPDRLAVDEHLRGEITAAE